MPGEVRDRGYKPGMKFPTQVYRDYKKTKSQGSLLNARMSHWKIGSMVIRSMGDFTDPYKWNILGL